MDAADLKSCSEGFLRTIEDQGIAGGWRWSIASGEQVWSPGFFRLLGLDPRSTVPDYGLLLAMLHPDDRAQLASAGEIRQGVVSPSALVRLIRPDGGMRILSLLSELGVSPEGRPLSARGVALDVTDRERLRQIHAAEQRRRQALYLTSYATTYSVGTDRIHDFPLEMAQVHGFSLQEITLNPFVMVVPHQREAFRERALRVHEPQARFQGTSLERLANGEVWRFRIIGVPLWDEAGRYRGRAGMKYPIQESGAAVDA
ncbi:PAS domain-containing protein, partial [Methylobacterium platani]